MMKQIPDALQPQALFVNLADSSVCDTPHTGLSLLKLPTADLGRAAAEGKGCRLGLSRSCSEDCRCHRCVTSHTTRRYSPEKQNKSSGQVAVTTPVVGRGVRWCGPHDHGSDNSENKLRAPLGAVHHHPYRRYAGHLPCTPRDAHIVACERVLLPSNIGRIFLERILGSWSGQVTGRRCNLRYLEQTVHALFSFRSRPGWQLAVRRCPKSHSALSGRRHHRI